MTVVGVCYAQGTEKSATRSSEDVDQSGIPLWVALAVVQTYDRRRKVARSDISFPDLEVCIRKLASSAARLSGNVLSLIHGTWRFTFLIVVPFRETDNGVQRNCCANSFSAHAKDTSRLGVVYGGALAAEVRDNVSGAFSCVRFSPPPFWQAFCLCGGKTLGI